jgi:hypothetical protein
MELQYSEKPPDPLEIPLRIPRPLRFPAEEVDAGEIDGEQIGHHGMVTDFSTKPEQH